MTSNVTRRRLHLRNSQSRYRKALRSSAEGTLANVGQVVHPSERRVPANRAVGNHLSIGDQRIRRRVAKGVPEHWRSYIPMRQEPVVRRVQEGASPPDCIYCGGPTRVVRQATSCDHLERGERLWGCAKTSCLGTEGAVLHLYPMAGYERRA